MPIERLHKGPRMSQAVIHNNTVYLAGQVAAERRGKSVAEQTQDILSTIDTLLAEAKTDKSQCAVGHDLAHRHVDLRGDEPGVGPLGGAGRRAGAGDGRERAFGGSGVQDRNRRHCRAALRLLR